MAQSTAFTYHDVDHSMIAGDDSTFEYVELEYTAPLRFSIDDAVANGDAYISPDGHVWF